MPRSANAQNTARPRSGKESDHVDAKPCPPIGCRVREPGRPLGALGRKPFRSAAARSCNADRTRTDGPLAPTRGGAHADTPPSWRVRFARIGKAFRFRRSAVAPRRQDTDKGAFCFGDPPPSSNSDRTQADRSPSRCVRFAPIGKSLSFQTQRRRATQTGHRQRRLLLWRPAAVVQPGPDTGGQIPTRRVRCARIGKSLSFQGPPRRATQTGRGRNSLSPPMPPRRAAIKAAMRVRGSASRSSGSRAGRRAAGNRRRG
jgi:hypothetical protein